MRDWLLLAVAAVILIFAAVGIVSAAGYVGGKVAAGPSKTHLRSGRPASNAVALRDVARAQAQATAIIKAAQTAGKSIVNFQTKQAHRQASTIIARAKSRVAAAAPVPTSAPATSSQATAPSVPTSNSAASGTSATGSSGTSGYPAASSTPSTASTGSTTSSAAGASGTTPSASTPNLSTLPATWLVVAYNATFGAGPGNAGSIAVINRSKSALSGVARVNYIGTRGIIGSATAPFTGLAPGQSEILPLNGMTYPTGAIRYQIEVTNVH